MTIHTVHPDSHTHGLADDCPRCAEHAEDPVSTLDGDNLRRIVRLAVDPDRFANALSETDLVAAAKVLNLLERVGHISRYAPAELLIFLGRYGFLVETGAGTLA